MASSEELHSANGGSTPREFGGLGLLGNPIL